MLATYAWVMGCVQYWESNLATLSIMSEAVKSANRLIDTRQKARSALEKQFARYEHRFQRASASELRKLLPPSLQETLGAEIDELLPTRNMLAHRYMRQVFISGVQADHQARTRELKAPGQRFADAADRLLRLAKAATPSSKPPNISDAQFAALQQLGAAAASGISLDDALERLAQA